MREKEKVRVRGEEVVKGKERGEMEGEREREREG